MPHTLVLGIGNTLLGDEGSGVWVIEQLAQSVPAPAGLELVDGGTLSFTLAPMIEDCGQFIAVDAAELQAPPGTIRVFCGEDMDRFCRRARNSVHEVGLSDLLDMARLAERLPARRALIAVQPLEMDWSTEPSAPVAAAIPQAAAEVLKLVATWNKQAAIRPVETMA